MYKVEAVRAVSEVRGASGRKAIGNVSPGANRVLEVASASFGAVVTQIGIPQLTMGSTGRGVSWWPAKPGWFSGRAG